MNKIKQKYIYGGIATLFIFGLIIFSSTISIPKGTNTASLLSPLWSLLGYSSEKEILSYNFEKPILIEGTFKEYNSQKYIFIEVPVNIARTGLTPIIEVSPGASVSPASGFSPDYFKQPVVYTVTAEDGTTQKYKVYLSGAPTQKVPKYISSCTDLQGVGVSLSDTYISKYILDNNIDCSDTQNWNNGAGFKPIGNSTNSFTSSFNGNGYTISNLYINRPTEANVGLFGYTNNASISNLKLNNVNIVGGTDLGGLIGSGNGSIDYVSVSGNLKATSSNSYVGGIAGNFSGSLKNTSFEGNINLNGNKTCIYSWASYPCSDSYVGGLVGYSQATIDNSYFNGDVKSDALYTGGLVGVSLGNINNSYARGGVKGGAYFGADVPYHGTGYTGGLIGSWWGGLVSNSYFAGDVSFKSLPTGYYYTYCGGGLTGDGWGATFNNSFASTNFSCEGACDGYNTQAGALGGCGRYITMKDSAVYYKGAYVNPFGYGAYHQVINSSVAPNKEYFFSSVGLPMNTWDKNIWGINPNINNNYPYLKSFNSQLEPKINFFVISGINGLIDQDADTIEVQVPLLNSEIKNIIPDITFDGVSISPKIGIAQDFTNPVVYTVTGLDGETREYTVTIANTINNISSCTDLQNIKNNTSLKYVLKNNIDCSDTQNWNSGKGFIPISGFSQELYYQGLNPITAFSGELYGEGYTIDNLYINRPTENNIGLFTNITGKVSNLGITNASVVGLYKVGILSAVSEGSIDKVYTTGNVVNVSEINNESVWTARDSSRSWNSITSSADGTKLAAVGVYLSKIYTSTDSGVTWTPRESVRSWREITSSADGTKLVALLYGGQIYTSTDSGVTWTPRESSRLWREITSSADGTKLAALVDSTGSSKIYTSVDSGITWVSGMSSGSNRYWQDITSSADGTKLAATMSGGQIYTSTDSGVTWTARDSNRNWKDITSSADGTKLATVVWSGQIYTSTDSGLTWIARESARKWLYITSSADGKILAAVVENGQIYISTDSGVTWTPSESNRNWKDITSSADGTKLAAVGHYEKIYTIKLDTLVGGLVGQQSSGKISNSYSQANVTGYYAGGLVGKQINTGVITDSYSTGRITSGVIKGGLISNSVSVTNSYWDTQTSGQTTSSGGVGKTTSQMKTPSTFSNWNNNIWNMIDGNYPTIKPM